MKKLSAIIICLALATAGVQAQNTFQGGYFMDGYLYAHKMNPALTANRGYLGIGVGRVGVQTMSNVGYSTLYYPVGNGKVESFLSDHVSSQEVLRKLNNDNVALADVQLDVFNLGFWTKDDRFHSISISAHISEGLAAPKEIFRFLKDGAVDGSDFSFSSLGSKTRAYVEASYGLSVPITESLRVGGKFKALVGMTYAKTNFNRFDVSLRGDRWQVSTDGTLALCNFPQEGSGQDIRISDAVLIDPDGIASDNLKPSGFGAAIDLGAAWDILPWLQLSASVTDLGFIRWGKGETMAANGNWTYEGFDNISMNGENDFGSQFEQKISELDNLLEFRKTGARALNDILPATFYAGAKFSPLSWLSAGVLGTVRSDGPFSWGELRGAVNLEPTHWVGLSASAATGTLGPKYSAMLNLRLLVFSLFVGAELSSLYLVSSEPGRRISFKDLDNSPVMLPRDNMNLDLTVGFNIVFGYTRAQRKALKAAMEEIE